MDSRGWPEPVAFSAFHIVHAVNTDRLIARDYPAGSGFCQTKFLTDWKNLAARRKGWDLKDTKDRKDATPFPVFRLKP